MVQRQNGDVSRVSIDDLTLDTPANRAAIQSYKDATVVTDAAKFDENAAQNAIVRVIASDLVS